MDLLQYTAPLLDISGQWILLSTLPHYWGTLGIGSPLLHCQAAGEH